jgi:hypothetical protein
MRELSRHSLAALAVSLWLAAPLAAKGPAVKLTIEGAGLPASITVTDPTILQHSNPWSGSFIGSEVAEPPPAARRYTVFFHVQLPAWTKRGVQMKYVVHYAVHPGSGAGFIYLPARGEDWYGLNVSTIEREGHGRWHRASAGWSRPLRHYLR